MMGYVKLSDLQMERLSAYLLDISKLIFGAAVLPLFLSNDQFSISQFIYGIVVSGLSFGTGLLLLKNKNI